MVSELSDAQIVRLLDLCNQVLTLQKEVPTPPPGFGQRETVKLEIAKLLRSRLEAHSDILMELGALLR